MAEKLYIIDGTALIYRSFFAFMRNPLINSKGENTSAAFGYASSLLRLIRDRNPDFVVVTFDSKEPTFRHEMYSEYKATREKMPEELVDQLQRICEVSEALNLPEIRKPGYEADDIMGTIAKRGHEKGYEVFLVTGDKDLMQLVNDRVFWMNLRKSGQDDEILDPPGVKEKFGVLPEKVTDVLALMGDSSDNVPGVPGVGPKTAIKLIDEFGSLSEVLENAEKIPQKGLRAKITDNRDSAELSMDLVKIDCDTPVEFDFEDFRLKEPDAEKAGELFRELEFTSLLEQLPKADSREEVTREYHIVTSEPDLELLVKNLKANPFVFDLETTSLDPLEAEIVGYAFTFETGVAYYVPVIAPGFSPEVSPDDMLKKFRPVFEDESFPKAAQNAKYDMSVLKTNGIHVRGLVFDTMIAAFLLNPVSRRYRLDDLSNEYLMLPKIPTKEVIGSGKDEISMTEVALETITEYGCEDADYTFRLWQKFGPMLEEQKLTKLMNEIELPLIYVLMDMERDGISLDTQFLSEMSERLHKQLEILEQEIYHEAGEEFNIGSPQQLGRILFEKLEIQKEYGVKRIRKTKLGYSTDISVLEQFSSHPLVSRILDYRQHAKLLSTYVDALPKLINPETDRVHTSFNQTVAITGRLSSTNPNLQNIPIRREQGREIRKAFVAGSENNVILAADYSQVELRIMAHLSKDDTMRQAFHSGEDIHTTTASRIYKIDPVFVSPEMRYRAKAINFGIMYGMSPYRLARDLEISNNEAQEFIMTYFDTFPGVNSYISGQIANAQEQGFVSTMMGRRRYLPELHSDNQRVRQNAENIAINTPIQGTAAELIKMAMISLHRRLRDEKLSAMLTLQIHDELVLETPESELEKVQEIVRECMENTIKLSVPLVVDMKWGASWYEAH